MGWVSHVLGRPLCLALGPYSPTRPHTGGENTHTHVDIGLYGLDLRFVVW